MGYDHLYATDMDRDYSSPLLDAELRNSLVRINRGLPVEAIDEALSKLKILIPAACCRRTSHLFTTVNLSFREAWTCFRFDRICFRERAQSLTSIRRYHATSRPSVY